MAKILIPLTILIIMTSLLHDPFHRESIINPRLDYGRRAWCIVQFSTSLVRIYNMIINIIHYVVPFAVSLIATIFILIAFLPHMSSLIIFVFPSKTYMNELKNLLRKISFK